MILRNALDAVSRASAMAGALLICALAVMNAVEATMRYAFSSPSVWVAPYSTFIVLAAVMLLAPDLVRRGGHVSIDLVSRGLSPKWRSHHHRIAMVICAAATLLVACISGTEAWRQFSRGTVTTDVVAFPKYLLSGLLCYGLFLSGLQFTFAVTGLPKEERHDIGHG